MNDVILTSPLATVQLIPIFNYMNLLSNFLFHENYLSADDVRKNIPIINALYNYLEDNRAYHYNKVKLMRSLLQDSDLYGEEDGEVIDEFFVNSMFDYIISSVVFEKYGNIFGFLADSVRGLRSLKIDYFLNVVRERLKNATFENESGLPSVLDKLSAIKIYNDIILPLFPKAGTNFTLLSLDYIFAQIGSMYLRIGSLSNTYYSYYQNSSFRQPEEDLFDDYLVMGQMIISLLHYRKIDPLALRVFALPTIIYYASTEAKPEERITNLIFSPKHWELAYQKLHQYIFNSSSEITNQLANDYKYKLHLGFSRFKTRIALAKSEIDSHCNFLGEKEKTNLIFTYIKIVDNFQCSPGVVLPNINEIFVEQISRMAETYGEFDLETTKDSFNDDLFDNLRGIVINLLDTRDLVDDKSKHFSYDLLEFVNSSYQITKYFALVRENYTVTLMKEYDNPTLFLKKIPRLEEFIQFAKRITLKFTNEGLSEFREELMKYKREQFKYFLQLYYGNETNNNWWNEFGLSLMPLYPCLRNDFNNSNSLCLKDDINVLGTFTENIISDLISQDSLNFLVSRGTSFQSIRLMNDIFRAFDELMKSKEELSTPVHNETDVKVVYEQISLHLEEPNFEELSIKQQDIKYIKKIMSDKLEESVNFNFTSVRNLLNQIDFFKSSIPVSYDDVVRVKSEKLLINSLHSNTAFGYKYINILSPRNETLVATLRTDYEFKDKIFIIPVGNSEKNRNTYGKLNDDNLEYEHGSFVYDINYQIRKKSVRLLFSGIWYDGNSERCIDRDYLEKHANNCLRYWRLVEKNRHLDHAVETFVKKSLGRKENFTVDEIRNKLNSYILPDDETFLLRFILNWSKDNFSEESQWSKICFKDDSDIFKKLQYEIVLETNTTIADCTFRINSLYTYRERFGIEEGTTIGKLIKDYNRRKNNFVATFEDYYAVRNFVTGGHRRITGDTTEAKLMKLALYKLALRQSDDLRNNYEWTLYSMEVKSYDFINGLHVGQEFCFNKFTLSSTSFPSAKRFFTNSSSGFRNIIFEMKFTDPYFRAKVETTIDFFDPIDEIKVILLPQSSFIIEKISIAPVTGLGNILRVVLNYDTELNGKYEWQRIIMNEINQIHL